MKCWVCDKDAHASCKFCGRFVCKEHAQTNIPIFLVGWVGKDNTPKFIAVNDVISCGICRPRPEPIEMPELY
jgi:hypothetical protein